jgi:nitrogen fixation NifU-like protein
MEIWLRVTDGMITEAKFMTDGCGTTIAAGSMVTEMVKGMPLSRALRIGQQDVLDALDGLPEESRHCALLAANTLREAVNDYYEYGRESWKRAYQKRMAVYKADEIRE